MIPLFGAAEGGYWSASAVAFSLLFLAVHVVSALIAALRWRLPPIAGSDIYSSVPVTILRPVCGIENFIEEAIASTFVLSHKNYEIIFCVARASDPIVPVVNRLIAANPKVPSRLLIGDERISANPKLNNLVKGWAQAQHDWVVMADSNVLMPPDCLQRLLAQWRADTGLVCSPPFASRPQGTWAELECAFLNTYQARWQYFADALGFGFAQGKTMLWRRPDLESWGGIALLAAEPAEDAAATKLVRSFGLRVRLVDHPLEQPLGERGFKEVWNRQLRWARLRRATFPGLYALEIFSTSALPFAAAALGGVAIGLSAASAAIAFLVIVYLWEAALARAGGSPTSLRSPLFWMLRDALFVGLWTWGWFGSSFTWRGEEAHALRGAGSILRKTSLEARRF